MTKYFFTQNQHVALPCVVYPPSDNCTLSIVRAESEHDAHIVASEYGGRVEQDHQGWKVVTPSVVC